MITDREFQDTLLVCHQFMNELFDDATKLQRLPDARTEFTRKCTQYLPLIRQVFSDLEDIVKSKS